PAYVVPVAGTCSLNAPMNVANPAVQAFEFVALMAVSNRATANPVYGPLAILGCAVYATHHGCAVFKQGPGVTLKSRSTSVFWSELQDMATSHVSVSPIRV